MEQQNRSGHGHGGGGTEGLRFINKLQAILVKFAVNNV